MARTVFNFSCRVCRRSRRARLNPTPHCDCGLAMEPNDPDILLPEERGQRAGYVMLSVPAEPAKLTNGMTRDEIIEAVNRKKRGSDLN